MYVYEGSGKSGLVMKLFDHEILKLILQVYV